MSVNETDWKTIALQLGAIDERACEVIVEADKLVESLESYINGRASIYHVEAALAAYKKARAAK